MYMLASFVSNFAFVIFITAYMKTVNSKSSEYLILKLRCLKRSLPHNNSNRLEVGFKNYDKALSTDFLYHSLCKILWTCLVRGFLAKKFMPLIKVWSRNLNSLSKS